MKVLIKNVLVLDVYEDREIKREEPRRSAAGKSTAGALGP